MTTTERLSGIRDGLGLKAPVRCATTANITLSGEQTIDGVAVVADDRVLVKDQSTASQNGIYNVSTGNWTRAKDFNGSRDVVQGTAVLVANGTTNANRIYYITTANTITIGTTSLAFDAISFPTEYSGDVNNVGSGGVGVFKQKTGSDLDFKNINAGSAKVTVTNDAGNNEVDIDVDETEFDPDLIPYDNATSGLTATTVQDAIDEVAELVGTGATSVGDASYTILATDRYVKTTTTFTTTRTWTLPLASTVQAGAQIVVEDAAAAIVEPNQGSAVTAKRLIIQRGGSDTINSSASVPVFLDSPRQHAVFRSDGVSNWIHRPEVQYPLEMLLHGLRPDKQDDQTIRLQPGFCTDSTGNEILRVPDYLDITKASQAAGGRDQLAAFSNGDDIFVYLIRNDTTGEVRGLLSASISYGGVTVPSGWTIKRKLRWGFVLNTAFASGGIPAFHISHVGFPLTTYTDSEYAATWLALSDGDEPNFTDIDLTGYVPDNARLALCAFHTRASGTSGSAYVRSGSGQSTGFLVGTAHPTNDTRAQLVQPVRVSSTRQLQYKVTGGALLSVEVLGYYQTEQS